MDCQTLLKSNQNRIGKEEGSVTTVLFMQVRKSTGVQIPRTHTSAGRLQLQPWEEQAPPG